VLELVTPPVAKAISQADFNSTIGMAADRTAMSRFGDAGFDRSFPVHAAFCETVAQCAAEAKPPWPPGKIPQSFRKKLLTGHGVHYSDRDGTGIIIESAAGRGASDLHLEAGMPAAVRVRGALLIEGEPIPAPALLAAARLLVGESQWPVFLERRRMICPDHSRRPLPHQCFADGTLASASHPAAGFISSHPRKAEPAFPTQEARQKHARPDSGERRDRQRQILDPCRTDSGNQSHRSAEHRHGGKPIEYTFRPRRSYIRQREVGRDTAEF